MRFAALETSTDRCSVALWDAGEIASLERHAGQRHGESLLPMLRSLLAQAGIGVGQLEAIAFGAGPGSFTGLRIACGAAQGLALAHDRPVIGISTLEAIAEEAGAARVLACIDARMREVYCSALEKRGQRWHEVIAARCVAPEAVAAPPGEGWIGCGDGFAVHGPLGLALVRPEIRPTAAAVARLAAPRLAAGEGTDAALAAPLYLRDKVALTTDERRALARMP
jgi:tRNA threonylcarbamoyladenosine biosynthesis protein TsaB